MAPAVRLLVQIKHVPHALHEQLVHGIDLLQQQRADNDDAHSAQAHTMTGSSRSLDRSLKRVTTACTPRP